MTIEDLALIFVRGVGPRTITHLVDLYGSAEQIFADIDRLHLHVSNEYEARSYEELKKKYGVK